MRGPIVYRLESTDNGGPVYNVYLPDDAPITAQERPDLLGGVVTLHAGGRRIQADAGDAPAELIATPYYANANRGPVQMRTWVPCSANDLVGGKALEKR